MVVSYLHAQNAAAGCEAVDGYTKALSILAVLVPSLYASTHSGRFRAREPRDSGRPRLCLWLSGSRCHSGYNTSVNTNESRTRVCRDRVVLA